MFRKTLPKTTPIPESDIPKSLPKPNIPYPSRRDDQKSRDKASNQMERSSNLSDLRFNIIAKIPLNENCSAMLLKKLPEKLGDPGKFLIPCKFPGMDVCHALADLGASINLMPLSIWKKLSLPKLTPTRITLELSNQSITHPKGLTKDIFVKVRNFHFPIDFVVVDFEADPRVPLILGRSFLRTSHALIDVYEGELVLRDGNAQITFHVNGTSKHPQKHENESIKLVNDAYKDSFKRFTNKPALVCLTPPKDVNDEKEKQEVKNLTELTAKCQTCITPCLENFKVIYKESIFHSNKPVQVSLVFAITSTLPSIEPKDSLIKGDEHLSTFSAEEIIPIPRESEDTSRSDSKNVLPSCDDFSSINDIECKDSYDSNLDESTFLVTPLSDSNKDKCLTPEDDIEILLHHDPSTPLKSVASILEGFINDPPFEENDDLFDLECKTNDEAELFMFMGDNDEIDGFLAIFFFEVPSIIMESHEDYINRMSLLCGNSSSRSPENFHTIIESLPTSTTLVEDNDSNREEIYIFSRPDDSIPPGVESDFDSEEDIINNLLNDDPIHEYEHLTFDIETIVP
ncbi:reverse transcriptase domain-containing protein [Tanacetum coccineum]